MKIYVTDKDVNLKETIVEEKTNDSFEMEMIKVYPDITYQTFLGMGGALTEASAYTYARMGEENKKKLLDLYFGEAGNNYNMARLHIQSSDFAIDNYAYVEDPADKELKTYSIERDRKYILPFIKEALKRNKDMVFIATPWSPPPFMKSNNDMNHGGKLLEEYADMWADMIVRFVKEYEKEGIMISRLSVQNEPAATQTWDSCVYTGKEEAEFIVKHLKKALVREGYGHIKIGVWDHNKEILIERLEDTYSVEGAYEATDAIFFHWYTGDHFESLQEIARRYPDKELIFTEGCVEYSRFSSTNQIDYAEKYAHDIIGDFVAGANAFTDWNVYLDEIGGPNHVGNYCDAPVMCNVKEDAIDVKKSFYYIGHFTRFIKPGAKRVMTSRFTQKVETLAFVNPDGEKVLVLLNMNDEAVSFNLYAGKAMGKYEIKPHSIMTMCW